MSVLFATMRVDSVICEVKETNKHKVTHIFLIIKLPYIKNGGGLFDFLACPIRMGGAS